MPELKPREGPNLTPIVVAAALFLVGLAYRAYLSRWLTFPAPVDACYYYDVGANLAAGRGFTINYVWNYLAGMPSHLPVPSNEYWQPLVSVILAGFFKVLGTSWATAKFCGALFGSFAAVLCLWYGLRLGLTLPVAACAAGLLAYQPSLAFASTSDTSVYAGVFVAAALLCAIRGGDSKAWGWWAGAGALAGLAYLTRSDGVLVLICVMATWLYYRCQARRPWWELALCLACFALPVIPWLIRNVLVFGKPAPVGLLTVALMNRYPDIFSARPEQFTLKAFLEAGLVYQAVSRLLTLHKAGEDLFRLISFVVLPFAAYELVRGRRERTHWPVLFYFLFALLFTTLVIPFAGRKGTFEHMLPAMAVFLWPMGMLAIVRGWRRIPRLARLNPLFAVALATALVVVHYTYWTVSSIPELVKMCNDRERLQVEADEWLKHQPGGDKVVFTDDPWSLHYQTGRPCVMVPSDDYSAMLEVAEHFGCRYVIWRPKEQIPEWPLGSKHDRRVVYRARLADQADVYEFLYPWAQGRKVTMRELAVVHLWAGIRLGQMGMMESAPAEFSKAINCDPTNFDAHLYMGAALRRLGRFKVAQGPLEQALQLRPDDPTARRELELNQQRSAEPTPMPLPASPPR